MNLIRRHLLWSIILCGCPAADAPKITTQPAAQTVKAGASAHFSVTVTGKTPLTYQWKANGAAVNGATSASYDTPTTAVSDDGTQFSVTISNSVGSVTSSNALLTVSTSAGPGGPSGNPQTLTFHVDDFINDMPKFIAFQDGVGAWQTVTPAASGDYTLSVTDAAGRYGVAAGDYLAQVGLAGRVVLSTVAEMPKVTVTLGHKPETPVPFTVTIGPALTGEQVAAFSFCSSGTVAFEAGTSTATTTAAPGDFEGLLSYSPDGGTTVSYSLFSGTVGDIASTFTVNYAVTVAPKTTKVTVHNALPGQLVQFAGGINVKDPAVVCNLGLSGSVPAVLADASGEATQTVHIAGNTSTRLYVGAREDSPTTQRGGVARYFDGTGDVDLRLPDALLITNANVDQKTPYVRPSISWTPTTDTTIFSMDLEPWKIFVSAGYGSTTFLFPDFSAVTGWADMQAYLTFPNNQVINAIFFGTSAAGDVQESYDFLRINDSGAADFTVKPGDFTSQGGVSAPGVTLNLCPGTCSGGD